jgi:hypothetical protein
MTIDDLATAAQSTIVNSTPQSPIAIAIAIAIDNRQSQSAIRNRQIGNRQSAFCN